MKKRGNKILSATLAMALMIVSLGMTVFATEAAARDVNHHHSCSVSIYPICEFLSGDFHTVTEIEEYYCPTCRRVVHTEVINSYTEHHFYDYNYNTNMWECACGDSYTHN